MASEPKKILFLSPSLMGGGAERVLSILLDRLDRTCFELHLGVLRSGGAYFKRLPDHVVIHDLRVSRSRYAAPAMVGLIRRLRPQAVMSSLRNMNMLLMLSKPFLPKGTRLVIRESAMVSLTLKNETVHPRIWAWLYRRLYRHADRVVALSDAMARDLAENFNVPPQKIVRIYNPVDSRQVCESAMLGESPFSGSSPKLVAAGRLSWEKGFDVLLNALPKIIQNLPTVALVILGDGPLKAQLMQQARRQGLLSHVSFPGFDANPWRYFRAADLFVLPSRYEGLPNVLLEALALGRHVVATDCPGGVQEIKHCSPEMVLAPPEDPAGLAEAVISAYRRFHGPSGVRQANSADLSRFDLQHVVAEYSRLF